MTVVSNGHFLPENGESPCMPAGQGYYIKLADGTAQNSGGKMQIKSQNAKPQRKNQKSPARIGIFSPRFYLGLAVVVTTTAKQKNAKQSQFAARQI